MTKTNIATTHIAHKYPFVVNFRVPLRDNNSMESWPTENGEIVP